ncbi:MAG: dATP/dGTP diphosphohydrolase domain-containing protein [Pseudomonadota bacterium]
MADADDSLDDYYGSHMRSAANNPVGLDLKDTNPKDAVGVAKWRQTFCIPVRVIMELGVAMLEGALKYGRANWTAAGVRASIYIDAAEGHLHAWKMGEDDDPDTGLSHLIKAMSSLAVLRDAQARGMMVDDRVPHIDVEALSAELQPIVNAMFEKHAHRGMEPWTEARLREKAGTESAGREQFADG